jgi:hypothetical protein
MQNLENSMFLYGSMKNRVAITLVNLGSLKLQAFDDDCLSWMNRDHDVETAQKFIEYISCDLKTRLHSFTIDLMFGRPNQRFAFQIPTILTGMSEQVRPARPRSGLDFPNQ